MSFDGPLSSIVQAFGFAFRDEGKVLVANLLNFKSPQ
jgi:hypothetical protein